MARALPKRISGFSGIAVKLSRLKSLGIEFQKLLEITKKYKILIDAEYERLDHVLFHQFRQETEDHSERLLVSVQMKRADSIEQLQALDDSGLKSVLVRGNSVYLNGVRTVKNAYHAFSHALAQFETIEMIGGSTILAEKIGLQDILSDTPQFLLELQGYQQLQNSSLWIYYNHGYFSKEAKAYLNRRSLSGNVSLDQFIATSENGIHSLLKNHSGYVFLDACCKYRYLELLSCLI